MPTRLRHSIKAFGLLVCFLAVPLGSFACSNAKSPRNLSGEGGSSGSGGSSSGSGGDSSGSGGGFSGNSIGPGGNAGGGSGSGSSDSGVDAPSMPDGSVLPPGDGGVATWPQASGPNGTWRADVANAPTSWSL